VNNSRLRPKREMCVRFVRGGGEMCVLFVPRRWRGWKGRRRHTSRTGLHPRRPRSDPRTGARSPDADSSSVRKHTCHAPRRGGRRVSARVRARGGPRAALVVRIASFHGSGARTKNKEQQHRESVRTRQFRNHAFRRCFCCVLTSFALIQPRRWGPGAGCVPGAARAAWAGAARRRHAPTPKEPQHPRPLRGERRAGGSAKRRLVHLRRGRAGTSKVLMSRRSEGSLRSASSTSSAAATPRPSCQGRGEARPVQRRRPHQHRAGSNSCKTHRKATMCFLRGRGAPTHPVRDATCPISTG
jgi:hypothetical protein